MIRDDLCAQRWRCACITGRRRSRERWLDAQRLVHVLVVELERQRRRRPEHLELGAVDLDLAGGQLAG